MTREVHFGLSALIIAVVGAAASLIIIQTAAKADTFGYADDLRAAGIPTSEAVN